MIRLNGSFLLVLAVAFVIGCRASTEELKSKEKDDVKVLFSYFDSYSHCGWRLEDLKVVSGPNKVGELIAEVKSRDFSFLGNYKFPWRTKLTFRKGVLVRAEAHPKDKKGILIYNLKISKGHPVLFSESYGTPLEFVVTTDSYLYGLLVEGDLKVYWNENYLVGAKKVEALVDSSWGGIDLYPFLKKGQVIVFEGGVPKLK